MIAALVTRCILYAEYFLSFPEETLLILLDELLPYLVAAWFSSRQLSTITLLLWHRGEMQLLTCHQHLGLVACLRGSAAHMNSPLRCFDSANGNSLCLLSNVTFRLIIEEISEFPPTLAQPQWRDSLPKISTRLALCFTPERFMPQSVVSKPSVCLFVLWL